MYKYLNSDPIWGELNPCYDPLKFARPVGHSSRFRLTAPLKVSAHPI